MTNNYYDNPGLSNSSLSRLEVSPKSFLNPEDKKGRSFDIGNAVDHLLTQTSPFEDYYCVIPNSDIPDPAIKTVLDHAYENDCTIETSIVVCNYQPNWKMDTRLKKITEKAEGYMRLLVDAKESPIDKTILSEDDYLLIKNIKKNFLNNQYTGELLDYPNQINQLEIYWKYKLQKCKSMLDKVLIYNDKKQLQPIDIKTTGDSVFYFDRSFIKFKYFRQASFYTEALKYYINISKEYKGYEILPFKFVIESTKTPGIPIIYETTENDIFVGKHGGILKNSNIEITGFDSLVEDYIWHKEHDLWEYPRKYYENKGKYVLDSFYGNSKKRKEKVDENHKLSTANVGS